jgi:hypothetical protein
MRRARARELERRSRGGVGGVGGDKRPWARECVFVLHRFCTDLEEYYVSVASKHFSPYLFLSTVPVAKRHGCEPDAPVTGCYSICSPVRKVSERLGLTRPLMKP